MKALMFGWEFPPHNSGGLGVACLGLARALVREGVELTFVLPKRMHTAHAGCKMVFADKRPAFEVSHELLAKMQSGYISSEEFASLKERYPELAAISGTLLEEVLRYGLLARRVALEEPHDVIHAHDWLSFVAGVEAKAVSGKPLVVHVHATEFDRGGATSVNSAVYAIERLGMEYADAVIAVSHYTKQMLVRHYGIPAEKISVVHNGIDSDDAVIAKSAEGMIHALKRAGNGVVLFVGRLTMQKGPDYFIEAARAVLAHRPNTVFVVSGAGDMERQVIQQAAYYGIGDKVLFAGFLRGDALARAYRMADVLVMPSVSEPFGIVPLESLANGVPVIVSKQSGVSEVLRHALKVDFWDVGTMANYIIAVLDHTPLQESLREQGFREVMGMMWKKAAIACMSVYQNVVQSRRYQPQA